MDNAADDFRDPRFGDQSRVTPNPGTPKTIGILNIIFACLLLLCGSCYGFYTAMFSFMLPVMGAQNQGLQASLEVQHRAEIDEIREKEQAAESDEERDSLKTERERLEAQGPPKMPDVARMWGLNDQRVVGFYMVDAISGLVLNLAMLITGVGLVTLHEWGRVGAISVAALKLLRLVVLYSYGVAVVFPLHSKLIAAGWDEEMVKAAPRGQGGAPPAADIAAMVGTMLTVSAVGVMIAGAVYPLLSLWLLTRPSTKAACGTTRAD